MFQLADSSQALQCPWAAGNIALRIITCLVGLAIIVIAFYALRTDRRGFFILV